MPNAHQKKASQAERKKAAKLKAALQENPDAGKPQFTSKAGPKGIKKAIDRVHGEAGPSRVSEADEFAYAFERDPANWNLYYKACSEVERAKSVELKDDEEEELFKLSPAERARAMQDQNHREGVKYLIKTKGLENLGATDTMVREFKASEFGKKILAELAAEQEEKKLKVEKAAVVSTAALSIGTCKKFMGKEKEATFNDNATLDAGKSFMNALKAHKEVVNFGSDQMGIAQFCNQKDKIASAIVPDHNQINVENPISEPENGELSGNGIPEEDSSSESGFYSDDRGSDEDQNQKGDERDPDAENPSSSDDEDSSESEVSDSGFSSSDSEGSKNNRKASDNEHQSQHGDSDAVSFGNNKSEDSNGDGLDDNTNVFLDNDNDGTEVLSCDGTAEYPASCADCSFLKDDTGRFTMCREQSGKVQKALDWAKAVEEEIVDQHRQVEETPTYPSFKRNPEFLKSSSCSVAQAESSTDTSNAILTTVSLQGSNVASSGLETKEKASEDLDQQQVSKKVIKTTLAALIPPDELRPASFLSVLLREAAQENESSNFSPPDLNEIKTIKELKEEFGPGAEFLLSVHQSPPKISTEVLSALLQDAENGNKANEHLLPPPNPLETVGKLKKELGIEAQLTYRPQNGSPTVLLGIKPKRPPHIPFWLEGGLPNGDGHALALADPDWRNKNSSSALPISSGSQSPLRSSHSADAAVTTNKDMARYGCDVYELQQAIDSETEFLIFKLPKYVKDELPHEIAPEQVEPEEFDATSRSPAPSLRHFVFSEYKSSIALSDSVLQQNYPLCGLTLRNSGTPLLEGSGPSTLPTLRPNDIDESLGPRSVLACDTTKLATIPFDRLVNYSHLDPTLGKECSRYYCATFKLRKKPGAVPRPDCRRNFRRKAKHISSGSSTTSSENAVRPDGYPVYLYWKSLDTCICGKPIAVQWRDLRGKSPDPYTSDGSFLSMCTPSLPKAGFKNGQLRATPELLEAYHRLGVSARSCSGPRPATELSRPIAISFYPLPSQRNPTVHCNRDSIDGDDELSLSSEEYDPDHLCNVTNPNPPSHCFREYTVAAPQVPNLQITPPFDDESASDAKSINLPPRYRQNDPRLLIAPELGAQRRSRATSLLQEAHQTDRASAPRLPVRISQRREHVLTQVPEPLLPAVNAQATLIPKARLVPQPAFDFSFQTASGPASEAPPAIFHCSWPSHIPEEHSAAHVPRLKVIRRRQPTSTSQIDPLLGLGGPVSKFDRLEAPNFFKFPSCGSPAPLPRTARPLEIPRTAAAQMAKSPNRALPSLIRNVISNHKAPATIITPTGLTTVSPTPKPPASVSVASPTNTIATAQLPRLQPDQVLIFTLPADDSLASVQARVWQLQRLGVLEGANPYRVAVVLGEETGVANRNTVLRGIFSRLRWW